MSFYFEGDRTVFSRLQAKACGRSGLESTSIAVVVLHGVLQGVFGVGFLRALGAQGLLAACDYFVGISAGAPAIAYELAGMPEVAEDVYCHWCPTKEFLLFRDPRNLFSFSFWSGVCAGSQSLVQIEGLHEIFRGSNQWPMLDVEQVARHRSRFVVAVTDFESGQGGLIDAKGAQPDMIQAIAASIAMIGANPVCVNDGLYADGSFTDPLPLDKIIAMHPSDILIVANGPESYYTDRDFQECVVAPLVYHARRLPAPLRRAAYTRYERMKEGLQKLRDLRHIRWGILWGDNSIGPFTANPLKLRAALHRFQQWTQQLLIENAS